MTIRLAVMASALMGLTGGVAGRAEAAFITYTESATLTGALGATSFTNATVTFTQTADTANVTLVSPAINLYEVVDATSTVTLTGGGFASPVTATISAATVTFSNQNFAFGGLAFSAAPQFVILASSSGSFATYNLQSSLGPISGGTSVNPGSAIATSQGSLIFSGFGATTTFTATTAAVPEPSSLALCGIASIAGLGYARSRGKRGATA